MHAHQSSTLDSPCPLVFQQGITVTSYCCIRREILSLCYVRTQHHLPPPHNWHFMTASCQATQKPLFYIRTDKVTLQNSWLGFQSLVFPNNAVNFQGAPMSVKAAITPFRTALQRAYQMHPINSARKHLLFGTHSCYLPNSNNRCSNFPITAKLTGFKKDVPLNNPTFFLWICLSLYLKSHLYSSWTISNIYIQQCGIMSIIITYIVLCKFGFVVNPIWHAQFIATVYRFYFSLHCRRWWK